jgi:hypothetical protein
MEALFFKIYMRLNILDKKNKNFLTTDPVRCDVIIFGLSVKRSLALREFTLGVEGLERFVRCEPLRKTNECVFDVVALESEPVDPRL